MKHHIQTRPSVHLLCFGPYLQEQIVLEGHGKFVPIKPLGLDKHALWVSLYAEECGASVDDAARDNLAKQGSDANPCVAIVLPIDRWDGPKQSEAKVENQLERLRQLLSWGTGNDVEPFGYVTLGPRHDESYFRLMAPERKKRTRLGFGNTGTDFSRQLASIIKRADNDEHFAFALSMLHDANKEHNIRFKIARLYSCLEALAHKLKKHHKGSRDAVRALLGIPKGRTGQANIEGRSYNYDIVLGAGKLRDLLFHGVPEDFSGARPEEADTFDMLNNHPDHFADSLKAYVELEVARWSNGASNGQIE